MMDLKGQVAMEYLLIFFILMILFSVFTIPLLLDSIDNSEDIIEVSESKIALSEISKNIKIIDALDGHSQKKFSIHIPSKMRIDCTKERDKYFLSTSVTLSDKTKKKVKIEVPCNVSFNGNVNHYYTNLNSRWYDVDVVKISTANGTTVNLKFT